MAVSVRVVAPRCITWGRRIVRICSQPAVATVAPAEVDPLERGQAVGYTSWILLRPKFLACTNVSILCRAGRTRARRCPPRGGARPRSPHGKSRWRGTPGRWLRLANKYIGGRGQRSEAETRRREARAVRSGLTCTVSGKATEEEGSFCASGRTKEGDGA